MDEDVETVPTLGDLGKGRVYMLIGLNVAGDDQIAIELAGKLLPLKHRRSRNRHRIDCQQIMLHMVLQISEICRSSPKMVKGVPALGNKTYYNNIRAVAVSALKSL